VNFRHYLAVLLALAALAAVAVGVYFNDSNEFGAMTLRKIGDGQVEIHRGNEVIEVDEGDEALEPQDLIVTGSDGDAVLQLEEGRKVHLARKSRLRIRSTTIVEAQQGSVLATANAPMQVVFDDVSARFSSAQFRLDRGFGSARAASYEGSVLLESPGEPRLKLERLFQVDVAAGDLPETSVPYRLSAKDLWDNEHLGEVVALTEDLDLLATGFERQVGSTRPGLDYFSDLSSGNVSFMRPYLSRPVTDLLVAFTIAENSPGSPSGSFKEAFDYMDEGASYGVAATILRAKSDNMVAQLEDLIVGTGAVAGDGGVGDASFGGDDGSATTAAASGGDDPGTEGDGETVSGEVGGETDENVEDCSGVVTCGVDEVQDELPPGPNSGSEEEEDPEDVVPGGSGGGGGGPNTNTGGGLLDGVLGNDGPLGSGLRLIQGLTRL
jgi:hypothetical protein